MAVIAQVPLYPYRVYRVLHVFTTYPNPSQEALPVSATVRTGLFPCLPLCQLFNRKRCTYHGCNLLLVGTGVIDAVVVDLVGGCGRDLKHTHFR